MLGVDRETRLALDPFQRDVLVGWRLARNDEAARGTLNTTRRWQATRTLQENVSKSESSTGANAQARMSTFPDARASK